jgi:hypothetical protein
MADGVIIKPDPELDGGSPLGTEDDLEDAGDLEFYDVNSDQGADKMYLARLPHHLFERWEKLDDDAEVQIGTIRTWTERQPNGPPKVRQPPSSSLFCSYSQFFADTDATPSCGTRRTPRY